MTKKSPPAPDSDEMCDHYDFDYSKARPNRFAERLAEIDDENLRPEYPPEFFKDMQPNRFAEKEKKKYSE